MGLATADSPDKPSQAASYEQIASQLEAAVHEALEKGSKRLLGAYLQSLLDYPDACTKGEQVIDLASEHRHRGSAASTRSRAIPEGAGTARDRRR